MRIHLYNITGKREIIIPIPRCNDIMQFEVCCGLVNNNGIDYGEFIILLPIAVFVEVKLFHLENDPYTNRKLFK